MGLDPGPYISAGRDIDWAANGPVGRCPEWEGQNGQLLEWWRKPQREAVSHSTASVSSSSPIPSYSPLHSSRSRKVREPANSPAIPRAAAVAAADVAAWVGEEMAGLGKAFYAVGFWIRETGQALDRLGCRLQGNYYFHEQRKNPAPVPPIRSPVFPPSR